ncbi:MAG TPA: hypothetical protein VIK18_08950, partial [Pirellulales bacterium]
MLALWNGTAVETTPDRDVIAFYLGLIAERQQDMPTAEMWYDRARSMSRDPERRIIYDVCQRTQSLPPINWAAALMSPLAVLGVVAAEPIADKPDHTDSQQAFVALVKPARDALAKAGSLQNRVKLMSALLLHAELASRPSEQLYTTANNHFFEGDTLRLA